MIDNTITDLLRTIYRSMAKVSLPDKGADWASLGDFGISIRNEGVDYKTMGYEKLSDFVSQTDAFFLWTDFSGQKPVKYIKEKRQRVYTDRKPSHVTNVTSVDSEEVERIKRRLRLDNNEFIGQFSPSKSDGWFKISDIRNSDFTKIEDKERGVKNLMISFKSYNKDFNKFAYYKFT